MPSPNPDWKPGDPIRAPFESTVEINPATVSAREMYKLIIGSIVPRPIAFISTKNSSGEINLAPFSFFNGVSSNPPCVMFSAAIGRSGEKKDTLRNIEEIGEFVINSANEWLIEALVHTAAEFPYGVSEMESVGLTPISSRVVGPPRVKESASSFECKLYSTMQIGDGSPGSSTIVVGEIVWAHVADTCYQDGRVLIDEFAPVGRLGGFGYGLVGETFEIPVPQLPTKP